MSSATNHSVTKSTPVKIESRHQDFIAEEPVANLDLNKSNNIYSNQRQRAFSFDVGSGAHNDCLTVPNFSMEVSPEYRNTTNTGSSRAEQVSCPKDLIDEVMQENFYLRSRIRQLSNKIKNLESAIQMEEQNRMRITDQFGQFDVIKEENLNDIFEPGLMSY
eukprot:TRINITY_DN3667_c0_g1_i2.p1 TRINITY_DN3667_c0_g1~~TRINITY_DN3667_c0_g1_i2.p1  ORF type:complete len:162 (-),score=35.16 TRINITY_DN3667_c0_g1_i2:77-562(-)